MVLIIAATGATVDAAKAANATFSHHSAGEGFSAYFG
jgi:hypothetical protein